MYEILVDSFCWFLTGIRFYNEKAEKYKSQTTFVGQKLILSILEENWYLVATAL